jgi:hypothetical protein
LSYSVISASGSDINAGYGYYITNVSGLSIIGSGAEGNTKEAIKAEASSALDASALYKDVKGLSISSFLSVENGKGSSSYPSFASFTAANSKPVHVTLDGPTEFSLGAANTNSLTASGEGVLITENQKDFLAAESVSSGALTTGARPVAQTIASLPTCSADLLGITGLVSDGTAFATGTYGSAVSATGSVARAVVCTNTAGATTYAWAYN